MGCRRKLTGFGLLTKDDRLVITLDGVRLH